MNAHRRAESLFDAAKKDGLINPVTGDGAPTHEMIAEELNCAESNGQAQLLEVAAYLRRAIRALRKHEPDSKLTKDAVEYLRCIGLTNPMRD
jgi:hypothetical protein